MHLIKSRDDREFLGEEKRLYGFVGDDVFADGEAHAGAEPEGGSDGSGNDAVSAHDLRRDVAQSASHFFPLTGKILPRETTVMTSPLSVRSLQQLYRVHVI